MNDRAPLGRLTLGAAVLTGERLRLIDKPVPDTLAVLVGVAERGRDAARRVLDRAGRLAPRPPKRVQRFLDDAKARGDKTIRLGRLEAKGFLQSTMDSSIRWAEQSIIPRMIDDLTPMIVNKVVPRVIDGAMPQIRTRVVPVIIDDLATDNRVRNLISEQSQGMVSDAANELRDTSARADDKLESSFRRMFRS